LSSKRDGGSRRSRPSRTREPRRACWPASLVATRRRDPGAADRRSVRPAATAVGVSSPISTQGSSTRTPYDHSRTSTPPCGRHLDYRLDSRTSTLSTSTCSGDQGYRPAPRRERPDAGERRETSKAELPDDHRGGQQRSTALATTTTAAAGNFNQPQEAQASPNLKFAVAVAGPYSKLLPDVRRPRPIRQKYVSRASQFLDGEHARSAGASAAAAPRPASSPAFDIDLGTRAPRALHLGQTTSTGERSVQLSPRAAEFRNEPTPTAGRARRQAHALNRRPPAGQDKIRFVPTQPIGQ